MPAFITSTSYSLEFSVLFWNAAASAGSDESFLLRVVSRQRFIVVEADGESPSNSDADLSLISVSVIGVDQVDSDQDGVIDYYDAFPLDSNEFMTPTPTA